MRPFLTALGLTLVAAAGAQSLTVMTYNIHLDLASGGADAWPSRREAVANTIAAISPDVFGVQEALPAQVAFLDEALPGYRYVGTGRDGEAGGEHSAIFYAPARYEVLAASTFWLSPTPDTVSVGWGAAFPRVATWARLRERASGAVLLLVNTQLDQGSASARAEGLSLVRMVADSLAGPGIPVVLMGDLGATPERLEIRKLRRRYDDAYGESVTRRRGPTGTFAGFDGRQLAGRNRVDYVLTRHEPPARVEAYRVVEAERDGIYLSDHLPVVAEVSFGAARREAIAAEAAVGRRRGGARGERAGPLPPDDSNARYPWDYIEGGTFGVSLGYSRRGGRGLFSYGPAATVRISRGFALGLGAAFARVDRGLGREASTVSTVGLAGRFYSTSGGRSELIVEIGPAVSFFEGEQVASLGLVPSFGLAGGGARLLIAVGGFVYGPQLEVSTSSVRSTDPRLVVAFAPTLGVDFLIGRKPVR